MFKWLHRLWNPHCAECAQDKLDATLCISCETLRQQLEFSNREREKLLEALLEKSNPKPVAELPKEEFKPPSKTIPWKVKKQMLESEDRELAKVLRNKEIELKTIEPSVTVGVDDLEKELDEVSKDRENAIR
jgi:hypothetical protein